LIVHNIVGQVIYSRKVNFCTEPTVTINIEGKGIYILSLITSGYSETKRIVLK
jgi:hypothetical protein